MTTGPAAPRRALPSETISYFAILWEVIPAVVIGLVIVLPLSSGVIGLNTQTGLAVASLGFVILASISSAFAACGLLEILKRLASLRGRFHRLMLRSWLGKAATEELEGKLALSSMSSSRRVQRTLGLAALDVPIEQLASRLSFMFESALADPSAFPLVGSRFAGRDARALGLIDELRFAKAERDEASQPMPLSIWLDRRDLDEPKEAALRIETLLREWAALTADIATGIQDELDSFQLTTARAWRRFLSLTSIAIASAAGALLAWYDAPDAFVFTTLVCATIGGFLSWVLRDITAGIERWRQRP